MAGVQHGVLRHIARYLNAAKQLEKVDFAIAYYCRLYAVTVGFKLKETKADSAVITELMKWCEDHRAPIKDLSREDAKEKILTLALTLFNSADDEERSGAADRKTADQFQTAYVLMDITRQFGELTGDISEKLKYALWKTNDIRKGIKEGKIPAVYVPPPEGPENSYNDDDAEAGQPDRPQANNEAFPSTSINNGYQNMNVNGYEDDTKDSHGDIPSSPYPIAANPQDLSSSFGNLRIHPSPATSSFSSPSSVAPNPYSSLQSSPPYPSDLSASPNFPKPSPYSPMNAISPPPAYGSSGINSPQSFPIPPNVSNMSNISPANNLNPPPRTFTPSPNPPTKLNPSASSVPKSAISVKPIKSASRIEAIRESERFIKHAQSALNFDDVALTIEKLQDAIARLLPYASKQ